MTAETQEWKTWLEKLAESGVLEKNDLNLALSNYRTVEAHNAMRTVGDVILFLLRSDMMEKGPPVADPRQVARAYLKQKPGKTRGLDKAAQLILDHLLDDGTAVDFQGLKKDYLMTSGKKTTWMNIFYQLQEQNPSWSKEWEKVCPLGV